MWIFMLDLSRCAHVRGCRHVDLDGFVFEFLVVLLLVPVSRKELVIAALPCSTLVMM